MPKKYLNFLLISVAFVVWMVIFYQFVFVDNNDEDYTVLENQKSVQVLNSIKKENIDQYLLKAIVDPFITPFNYSTPKPKVTKSKSPPKPQNVPKLQLLGILSDKEGPMAIIGFPNNSIQFVREKQKIDKFTIMTISENTVKYKYENIFQTLNLN